MKKILIATVAAFGLATAAAASDFNFGAGLGYETENVSGAELVFLEATASFEPVDGLSVYGSVQADVENDFDLLTAEAGTKFDLSDNLYVKAYGALDRKYGADREILGASVGFNF